MDNQRSKGAAVRVACGTERLPKFRKAVCLALSCLIALPFGGTALSFMQANAEPVNQDAVAPAPSDGDVSSSTTIDVSDEVDGASALEAADATHMPTLEEALGGGARF